VHIPHTPTPSKPPPHGPDGARAAFGSRRSRVELRPLRGLARLRLQIPAPRFGKLLRRLILHRTLREWLAERFCCRKSIQEANGISGNAGSLSAADRSHADIACGGPIERTTRVSLLADASEMRAASVRHHQPAAPRWRSFRHPARAEFALEGVAVGEGGGEALHRVRRQSVPRGSGIMAVGTRDLGDGSA